MGFSEKYHHSRPIVVFLLAHRRGKLFEVPVLRISQPMCLVQNLMHLILELQVSLGSKTFQLEQDFLNTIGQQ